MGKKKVLIADDDKTVLQAGKLWLEGKGYRAIIVDDGMKAIEEVRKENPEFALLDVVMPGKDGFEVCREIKQNSDTSSTIVIIISGNVPEIEKGFDYGADDCIIKPLDWDKLSERMEVIAKEKWDNTRK
ncbi:MAG: response regulator [Elusimicrobiota bacterium]